MHTLEVPGRVEPLLIPANWHEMNDVQRAFCLQQLIWYKFCVISYNEFYIRCFIKLADIQYTWRTYLWEKARGARVTSEKNSNLLVYAQRLVTFHHVDKARTFELSYDCEIPPFEFGSISWRKYLVGRSQGPDALLSNLTFGEFRHAIIEMNEYFSSQDPNQLCRFIACLYRPLRKNLKKLRKSEAFDGHSREPFNPHRISTHARHIRYWPDWKKMAVLLWFTHCIKVIQREDLTINGREICLAPLFPKSPEGEDPTPTDKSSAGWSGILTQVAKEGLYGTASETDRQELFTILLFMYDQHLQNKALERKYSSK